MIDDSAPSPEDVQPIGLTVEQATDKLLKRYQDARKKPSEPKEAATPTEEPEETPEPAEAENEEPSDPDDEEDTQEDPEEPAKKTKAITDETKVTVKVDGEDHQVSVKELKRLWGQEAALTRKSQELAQEKQKIKDDSSRYVLGLQKLVEKAQQRWEPYSKIDLLVASKELSSEQLTALRQDMQEAYNDYAFLTQNLDGEMTKARESAQTRLVESARECVNQITDESSPHHIPGWSNDLYNDIRSFAVGLGVPQETVDTETSPVALKVLHMAMQFAKAQKVVTEKTKQASPKKTIKGRTSSPTADEDTASKMRKLQKSGNFDDAVAVLLARSKKR